MQPESKRSRKGETVAGLCRRYMEEHAIKRKTKRSAAEDRRLIERRVLPQLGDCRLDALDVARVSGLHASLAATPYEANRTLALLRKMLNLAEDWGLLPEGSNPCRRVKPFEEEKRARPLGAEELARLGAALKEADQKGGEDLTAIAAIRLLLLTGCRVSELLALRWDDVDWTAKKALIRGDDPAAKPRVLHLGKGALGVLGELPYVSDFVLPALIDPENPLSLSTIEHVWRRLRVRSALNGVRLHDLRHTFVSQASEEGCDPALSDVLLGYRTRRASDARSAPHPKRLKEAADAISVKLAKSLAPPGERSSTRRQGRLNEGPV